LLLHYSTQVPLVRADGVTGGFKMIHPVSNSTQTQATVQPKAAPQQAAQPQQPAQPKPASPTDTVTLSAAKQIAQEAVETSAQTTKEAAGGDVQAKRLLAREAADNASVK
jgi:hypothetical protein